MFGNADNRLYKPQDTLDYFIFFSIATDIKQKIKLDTQIIALPLPGNKLIHY